MFKATASCAVDYDSEKREYTTRHYDQPISFNAGAHCVDNAEAEALAATFPKFVKVKVLGLSGVPGKTACVWFLVDFSSNDVNKGANETVIKRVRRFVECAGQIEWETRKIVNGYDSLDHFMSNLPG